jgi:RimJ/RimL family protein N-acetyltransferase
MPAPRLETDRLILRGHRPEDFAESFGLWSNPEVVRHISGKPSAEQEAWARLLRYAGLWDLLGLGFWLVEEKATGRFLGEAGFAINRRDIDASARDNPEVGWVIAPPAQGRGFAAEAAAAVVAWGDANLAEPRTVCLIAPENAASLRIAEKVGYRRYAETDFAGGRTILLERFRP